MKKIYILVTLVSLVCGIQTYAQNVGIGTANPTLAKLQVNGSVGASVAMFGADKNGVTISADNPEIGFNYYFNAGSRTIKAGFASLMGMVPASGDFYLGNFNNNQSVSDNGTIAGYQNRMVVKQSGRIGLGVDNPTRAALEQNGSVVNTAALFGGEGKGVSLQKDWPAIGLNHYYNGNHLSIGGGYGAQIGVDQNNGAIYFAQFSNSAPLANGLLLNPIAAINFKYGKIGVNTINPQSSIEIKNVLPSSDENALLEGLRLTDLDNNFWNIYPGYSLFFYKNGVKMSAISGFNGSYLQVSDGTLKKFIAPMVNDGIQKVNKLKPSSYLFLEENENTDKRHIGFIAQEVEEVVPEVVITTPDGKKMMNYAGLVPVLTKAIQEQQKIIEKQQQQIDWLMKKVQ